MSQIIDVINELPELMSIGAADKVQIEIAEKELGIKFAEEYKEYLQEFGAILADDIELTGISKSKNRDVIYVTKREWELNCKVSHSMYVIENISIDGIIIWQDGSGKIYESTPKNDVKLIADSLVEYLLTK